MGGYLATLVIGLATALLLKAVHSVIVAARLRQVMPPGPPGLPLLGHAHKIGSFQWLQFAKWQAEYGSIFSLNLAGQPAVVISDLEVVSDLLDNRSAVYSDRPRWIMASEILTGGMFMPFMPYNDMWRRMRRLTHDKFHLRACPEFCGLQEREAAALVVRLAQDPSQYSDHLGEGMTAIMLQAIYGRQASSTDGQDITRGVRSFMHRVIAAALPGTYLVDMFPWMMYVPSFLAKWKREGRKSFMDDTRMFVSLLAEAQKTMDSGASEPCIAHKLMKDRGKYNVSLEESAWLAGTMLIGGAHTTAASTIVFILAMVLYPDVMRHAQKQIDAVVGRERLPSFEDRAKLPYIEAMVKEVLRWRPITPLGGPRRTTQDDQYQGYLIPKGTLVLYNTWSMHRDPKYFPDHDEFRPERYLDSAGQITDCVPNTHGYGHLTYGTGRRICPGKDFANQALFIHFAVMLWAFDFGKAIDADGRSITPSRTECVDDGLAVHPAPFECSITPRFPEVSSLALAAAGDSHGRT